MREVWSNDEGGLQLIGACGKEGGIVREEAGQAMVRCGVIDFWVRVRSNDGREGGLVQIRAQLEYYFCMSFIDRHLGEIGICKPGGVHFVFIVFVWMWCDLGSYFVIEFIAHICHSNLIKNINVTFAYIQYSLRLMLHMGPTLLSAWQCDILSSNASSPLPSPRFWHEIYLIFWESLEYYLADFTV